MMDDKDGNDANALAGSTAVDHSDKCQRFDSIHRSGYIEHIALVQFSLGFLTVETIHDIYQHRLSYFRLVYLDLHYGFDLKLVYIYRLR